MEDKPSLTNSKGTDNESTTAPVVDDAGRMEAVRELLFGRQIEEMHQSLGSVEARLTESLVSGRRVLERQIESLETYARDELASVREAITREESERTRGETEARGRMEAIESEVAAKARRFTDDIAGLEKSMHERFLEQTKLFSKKLEEAMDQMREDHKREIQALQDAKTDRSALGDMMIDLGMRLQGGGAVKGNTNDRTGSSAVGDTLHS